VLFGEDEVSVVLEIQNQLTSLLKLGGFHLRKWASNYEELLLNIPYQDRLNSDGISFQEDSYIKALGLYWNPCRDCFYFNLQLAQDDEPTKRSVLSLISRIFDPLGLISPVVISAKIMIQELWLLKVDWDSLLPAEFLNRWNRYRESLTSLRAISIPRWTNQSKTNCGVELHGFADASNRAYAAVVYVRVLASLDEYLVMLIMSKTKVAPVKTISIPRLELCAAVLLARLIKHILQAFDKDSIPVYCPILSLRCPGLSSIHPAGKHS